MNLNNNYTNKNKTNFATFIKKKQLTYLLQIRKTDNRSQILLTLFSLFS